MFPAQLPQTNPDEFIRCGDPNRTKADEHNGHNKNTEADADLAHEVDHALWKDDIFRATDYDNIDVRVRGGIVYLYGHASSLTNQHQAERVLQTIPGLLGVKNFLIPDDRLLVEVSTALGRLESAHACKFFTGVSHGVVLLSGNVGNAKIKLLAEQCAASNPNVRGVINSVLSPGNELELSEKPFLQPSIGAEIFFLDGVSGRVSQVIINPDNRLVVAVVIQGRFADQRQQLKSMNNEDSRSPERQIVLSMNLVRYLTRVSGFLKIKSSERNRYMEFDPTHFFMPNRDWKAPYPYCADDVLFPVEHKGVEDRILQQLPRPLSVVGLKDQSPGEQLNANDSLGG
jgi:osmotically-inducible protein OsmY